MAQGTSTRTEERPQTEQRQPGQDWDAERAARESRGPERAGGAQRSPAPSRRPRSAGGAQLVTEAGRTTIAETVVAKVAGLAAREIPGVQSMGSAVPRRMGQLRSLIPGAEESVSQGVSVEVGEKEAAVDLDIVTWYGQSIVEVADAVRENVRERIETMTGLKTVEVNVNVDDVYVEGEVDRSRGDGEDRHLQ